MMSQVTENKKEIEYKPLNVEEEVNKVTKSLNLSKIAKKLLKKARDWI
jgi:hypothetical protein